MSEEIKNTQEQSGGSAKSKKIKMVKDSMRATLQEDADYLNRACKKSKSIKVINTLAFGKTASISSVDTSKIVGYRLQNVGKEPIQYTTKIYTKGADGKYVGQTETRTAAPGETFELNRVYTTMFAMKEEYAFTFANGTLVAGPSAMSSENDKIEDTLASFYFRFKPDADGNAPSVYDEGIKISIDQDGAVKEEFNETFGYLNKVKSERATKNERITTQVMMANYIQRLVKDAGGID